MTMTVQNAKHAREGIVNIYITWKPQTELYFEPPLSVHNIMGNSATSVKENKFLFARYIWWGRQDELVVLAIEQYNIFPSSKACKREVAKRSKSLTFVKVLQSAVSGNNKLQYDGFRLLFETHWAACLKSLPFQIKERLNIIGEFPAMLVCRATLINGSYLLRREWGELLRTWASLSANLIWKKIYQRWIHIQLDIRVHAYQSHYSMIYLVKYWFILLG